MLRNKKDIENYEEKAALLRKKGWETWYNDDYWIRTEWKAASTFTGWEGTNTDDAYEIETREPLQLSPKAEKQLARIVKRLNKEIK